MKYNKQLIFPHSPQNELYGDCFRTCIACMLDMEPADVPHFADKGRVGDELWGAIETWFRWRDMYLLSVPYPGDLEQQGLMNNFGVLNPGCRYMLGGRSPHGTSHVVVCLGDKMEWDPAPPGDGLVGPCENDGLWWVHLIGSKV